MSLILSISSPPCPITTPGLAVLIITLVVVLVSGFNKKVTRSIKQKLINVSHKKNIYINNSYSAEIYDLIYVSLLLMLFVSFWDSKHIIYIINMLENTDKIQNILASLTTLSATISLVIVVIDKKYYILF